MELNGGGSTRLASYSFEANFVESMFPSKATIHQKKKKSRGWQLLAEVVYLIDENIGATCQALVRLTGLYYIWSDQGYII
jgi:hypothetical protein